ncbi:MAG: efflux RND transporter periplasmic adaptor subunit [Acidobacteriota bacterium]
MRFPLAGIAFATLFMFGGCGARSNALRTAPAPNTKTPITVQVVEARQSEPAGDLLVPAALSVEVTAMVLARRDGAISQLSGQEGSRVIKGHVIAQLIGDDELRAQLRQAELEVKRLEVEQRQYDALVKLNRNELEREQNLFKQGFAPEREVERAQFKYDGAVLELEKTRVASQVAQARVTEVKAELDKSTVRAPITGIVTHRFAKLGTNVVKNDRLFEITQLAPLQVKFQVPQTERGALGPGSVLNLSAAENDQIIARARIRRTDPVAEAASNTIGFLADLISGTGLMPGMAVNVHVPRRDAGPSMWIPQAAFPAGADVRKGTTSTVFVAAGDKCVARTVWVNSVIGDQVEIVSGLAMGDRVIISPPAELKDGDLVAVKP